MDYNKRLEEIKNDIDILFKKQNWPYLFYHNIEHTYKVVVRAREIAANYALDNTSMFILLAAAWFHDVGHLYGPIHGHEERGAAIAAGFLATRSIDEAIIEKIENCIVATKPPTLPRTLLQEILCDADTHHFGTAEFAETNELVKKEFQLRNGLSSIDDWETATLYMLEEHEFYTDYCKSVLNKGKEANITALKNTIK